MRRETSVLMEVLDRLGLRRWAWSARRLHCPVGKDDLVLDVGSGGNPYPRANVLLDAYEDTPERFHLPLIKDRPMVLGAAERMPFKEKAFDFVIASHVLEHTSDPDSFIQELMRVGKAGYIETPDGFFERINPFRFHRLEVYHKHGRLHIFKKPSWRHDSYLVDGYENQVKCGAFLRFTSDEPRPFYVRYYWDDKIDYVIDNPEVSCDWPLPTNEYATAKLGVRYRVVSLLRRAFSQRRRNAQLDVRSLLACPACGGIELSFQSAEVSCPACGSHYPIRDGVPVMYPPQPREHTKAPAC